MTRRDQQKDWVRPVREKFKALGLPPRYWNAIYQYLAKGSRPGHFLQPMLENNFTQTVIHADDENQANLKKWAQFMVNGMPLIAWGSTKRVHQWRSMGGWEGHLERGCKDLNTEPLTD